MKNLAKLTKLSLAFSAAGLILGGSMFSAAEAAQQTGDYPRVENIKGELRLVNVDSDGDRYLIADGSAIDVETAVVDGRERIVLTNTDGDRYLLADGSSIDVKTKMINGEERIVLTNSDGDEYLLASHIK